MTHDDTTRVAWERSIGEGPRAFSAFTIYRDLGADRSLDKAWMAAHPQKPARRRSKCWAEWSRVWGWVARAQAWDNELDRQARLASAKTLLDAKARQLRMVLAGQQAMLVPTKVILQALTDPTTIEKLVQEARRTPLRFLEFLDRAARSSHATCELVAVERLILGMSTEHIELQDSRSTSIGAQIPESAAATALAIALLNEIAGTEPGSPPPTKGAL